MNTAPRTVIVGGGIAGLAAATILAERGLPVTLLERDAQLGGRLASWPTTLPDGTTMRMERGFHAFFRQYYNLRALLRRWDPELARLIPLTDYPILAPQPQRNGHNGRSANGLQPPARLRFDGLPKRAPLNVAVAAFRGRQWLPLRAFPKISIRHALQMLAWDPARADALDRMTAKDYLDALRFPPAARAMLFDVFAHSFFNPEAEMSAAELLEMFHFYFTGNPEGLIFDVLDDAFGPALFDPWTAYLEKRGADLRTGSAVTRIEHLGAAPGARFRVTTASATFDAEHVVLALEPRALQTLVAASPTLAGTRLASNVATLGNTAPFAVWRLWLDRPAAPEREPFVGTTGYGRLDNISVYPRLEKESRAWADKTGGTIIELHAYGLLAPFTEAELRQELRGHLDRIYPELAGARTVHEVFLLRDDCPSFAPGARATRPGVTSDVPGLTLAGDGIATPFPAALMERAAATGILAANTVLSAQGLAPERVPHIPTHGMLHRAARLLQGRTSAT